MALVVRIQCKSTSVLCSGPKVDLDGYASKKKKNKDIFLFHLVTIQPSNQSSSFTLSVDIFFFNQQIIFQLCSRAEIRLGPSLTPKVVLGLRHTDCEVWNRSLMASQSFLDYWSMEPLCGWCAFTSALKEITHKHCLWASVCVVHRSFFKDLLSVVFNYFNMNMFRDGFARVSECYLFLHSFPFNKPVSSCSPPHDPPCLRGLGGIPLQQMDSL